MIRYSNTTEEIPQPRPVFCWRFRDELPAVLSIMTLTILVELGSFIMGRFYGSSFGNSLLAALGVSVLWCVIAPGSVSVGGRGLMSTFVRGGVIADTTAISMLVLWIVGCGEPGGIDFLGVVKIYCICVPLVLTSVGCVAIAKSPVGRSVAVLIAVSVLFVTLASPLLINPWIVNGGSHTETLGAWAVRINPFFAVCDAVVVQTGFIWRQGELMYEWSQLGETVIPPPIEWYQTALLYAGVALTLWVVALIRTFCCCRRKGNALCRRHG